MTEQLQISLFNTDCTGIGWKEPSRQLFHEFTLKPSNPYMTKEEYEKAINKN